MSRRFMGLATALLLLIATPSSVSAGREMPLVHTALTEFDACLPLADGRVLAGSAGGLVLVDAQDRQEAVYTQLDGLPGTRIHSLFQNDDGLWVGTEQGVARVSLRDAKLKVESSHLSSAVRGLWADAQGLYLATWGQGLLHMQDEVLVPAVVGSKLSERVTSVLRHEGTLWWTTAGAGLWRQTQGGAVTRDARFGDSAVLWSLSADKDTLWVAGEDGLGTINAGPRLSNLHALRASAEIDGKRVVASFGSGAQVWRNSQGDLPDEPFVRSVHSAHGLSCIGGQESLWIRRAGRWSQAKLKNRAHANDIAAFASDGTRSFAGSFDHGVAELKGESFVPFATDIDPHINALAIDAQDGSLWIGTSTGLVRYHEQQRARFTKREGLPSRHVMSLYALREGGVLVGTAAGAAIVRGKEVEAVGGKGPRITGNVWAVAHSADGSHWLGTTQGVFRIRNQRVSRYRVASGELSDDWVMALAVADDGVFVGTYKGGVVRLLVDGNRVVARPLGEGWINPSGLHWDGTKLRAATMQGAMLGNGIDPIWSQGHAGPGTDTTAFVPAGRGGAWVVTRRGLVRYPGNS